jgi:hypothetical protein
VADDLFIHEKDTGVTGDLSSEYRKHIYLDEHFISDEECKTLVEHCKQYEHLFIGGYDQNKPPWFTKIFAQTTHHEALDIYSEKAAVLARARYGRTLDVYDTPTFRILTSTNGPEIDTSFYLYHCDSEVEVDNKVDMGVNWLQHKPLSIPLLFDTTILVYINSEFEGGELVFPQYDLRIKPKAGDMLMFPSGHQYSHYVTPVTGGTRWYFSTFLVEPKTKMLFEHSTFNDLRLSRS